MPAYKNSQRHTWYCSFYYTDWQGHRKKKKKEGFPTKRSALAWERKFLEIYASHPHIRFSSLVAAYKKFHQENTRQTTHYIKNSMIDNHILPFFKDLPICQITKQQITAWKSALSQKNFKPQYAKQVYGQLKSIFNFAVEHYNLPANPCPSRTNWGERTRTTDYWTIAEFRQFTIQLKKPHHIMAFYLLFWTGLRCGELLALTWKDIDFSTQSITVSKTLTRLHKQDIITAGKTAASRRTVIMTTFLTAMLQDYHQLSGSSTGRIFTCTRNSLTYILKKYAARAQLKNIRLHDLRHSHASLLINAGFPPLDVADRLGHANPTITLSTYSHFYDNKRAQLAEKLNNLN